MRPASCDSPRCAEVMRPVSPRRVLFLVNTLETGGTERNVTTFCRAIDRARYVPEVWVLNAGVQGAVRETAVRESGIVVRDLARRSVKDVAWTLGAAWRIARSGFDLVHAFLPTIAAYASLGRALFRFKQPFVLSVGTSKFVSPREERLVRHVFRRTVDEAVGNSPAVARYLRELGFDPSHISVVPNGHDPARYDAPLDREALRASVGIRDGERMLVYVGRFIESKRTCDLVEAIHRLAGHPVPFRVLLVGDGHLRPELEAQIASLGLGERVTFLGSRKDVPELLRAADLFVFPSALEGLPNAVVEACLAGVPVVAADIPGTRDVVRHGETALLPPVRDPGAFAEAIGRMLDEPALAKTFAARAQAEARATYTIERSLEALYGVYARALAARG